MATTYEKIATTTLSSATNTISFGSIPTTYTDLKLVLVATTSTSNQAIYLRVNADSGTNYSYTYVGGNGTAASSSRQTSVTNIDPTQLAGSSTTVPQMWDFDIFSYAGSTNKTVLYTHTADLNGSGATEKGVGLWRSTTAINAVSLTTSSGNMNIGTTATLYGILKA